MIMTLLTTVAVVFLVTTADCSAFLPSVQSSNSIVTGRVAVTGTVAFLSNPDKINQESALTAVRVRRNENRVVPLHPMQDLKSALAVTLISAALWSSPVALLSTSTSLGSAPLSVSPLTHSIRSTLVADAKEMASGSGSRVNKDPESLLRYGLPIPKDKEVSYVIAFMQYFYPVSAFLHAYSFECDFRYTFLS